MILLTAKRWLFPCVLALTGSCLVVACSEESEDEETEHEEAPDCAAIGDVCTHDVHGDLAEECHEISHANDAAECAERKDDCVDFCTSAAGEGGGSGATH